MKGAHRVRSRVRRTLRRFRRALFAQRKRRPPLRATGVLEIAMMVRNPGTHDTRVRKEAESLARAGHNVRVIATSEHGLPRREWRNGVLYERIEISYRRRERLRARYLADQVAM